MKEVDADTLELIPNTTPIPVFTDTKAIEQAIQDLVHIIKYPQKNNMPRVMIGDKIRNEFQEVATTLKRNHSKSPYNNSIPEKSQSTTKIDLLKKLYATKKSEPSVPVQPTTDSMKKSILKVFTNKNPNLQPQ